MWSQLETILQNMVTSKALETHKCWPIKDILRMNQKIIFGLI